MKLKYFLAAFLLTGVATANAALIRVSQESASTLGDFNANVLGFINAFDSLLTAADYYDYNTIPASFNDGAQDVTLTSNKSHFFFVNGADGLSAFIVHDKPLDGTGGMADMTLNLSGDTAALLVTDDTNEGIVSGGPNLFQTDHNWIACCTDGFVIGALDGAGWELLAEFDSRNWSDFAGWMAFDGSTVIDLTDDFDRRVRFDLVAVPEPGTLGILGLGLLGLGFARRK